MTSTGNASLRRNTGSRFVGRPTKYNTLTGNTWGRVPVFAQSTVPAPAPGEHTGLLMKLHLLFLLPASLCACDKREVKACEAFVKEGLKSPSSYQRVNVRLADQAMTDEEWKQRQADVPFLRSTPKPTDQGYRTVLVEYDAQNGYGTAMREVQACRFPTKEGEVNDAKSLDAAVLSAASQRSFRDFARSGALSAVPPESVPPEPEYPCC